MKTKNAIGYIRISTQGQAMDEKFGIEVQKKDIETYAQGNGYKIIEWKTDITSGTSDNRPELDKILYGDNVVNPPVDAVIVFKSDRVARDTKLYFYYLFTLEKKSIKLISVQENFQEGSDYANIYRSLTLFVAEQERKNIALRTSKGRSLKASCGGFAGGKAPYGYKVENGALVINEDEKELVLLVFKLRDLGKSMSDTAMTLYESGYRTRKGGMFQPSTVKSILDNKKTYEGLYRYGKENPWVQGVHEPILK